MEPYTNSKDWKEFRRRTAVTIQLNESDPSKIILGNQDPEDFSDEDADGKPMCNMWKGQNYSLHVLGPFENDFKKQIKAFQVPLTVSVALDPFCRSEFPSDDHPPSEEAFLIWKGKELPNDNNLTSLDDQKECLKLKAISLDSDTSSISDDEDDNHEDWDEESDAEPEICNYIAAQRQKKKEGLSLTGEELLYDNENEVIRNLHTDSISLTNYGTFQEDKAFGNPRLLFDQLLTEEKLMLMSTKISSKGSILVTENSTVKEGKSDDSHVSLAGGGDN